MENGINGKRMAKTCDALHVSYHHVSFPEHKPIRAEVVREILAGDDKGYNMVAVAHCEASSGVVNNIEHIGKLVKEAIPGTNRDKAYLYGIFTLE